MSTKILEEGQLSALAELERLCFPKPWSEDALSLLLREGNFGVVSLEGERVCAYAGIVTVPPEGEITNVATHPDCRRRGYAREALLSLIDEARNRNICRVTLEVRESNTAARALYESLGFTLCGRRKNFYSQPREDGLILEKVLL